MRGTESAQVPGFRDRPDRGASRPQRQDHADAAQFQGCADRADGIAARVADVTPPAWFQDWPTGGGGSAVVVVAASAGGAAASSEGWVAGAAAGGAAGASAGEAG